MNSLAIGKDIVWSSYQQKLIDEVAKNTAGMTYFTVPACDGMSPGRAISIGLSNAETTLSDADVEHWDIGIYTPEKLLELGWSAHEVMEFQNMSAQRKREKIQALEVKELRKRMADLMNLFR